ncbi:MAG: Vitamin B12 import ATP-binding protein BtuD [Desulfovibrio sp.]
MTGTKSLRESMRILLPLVPRSEKKRFPLLLGLSIVMALTELGIAGLVALMAAAFSSPDAVMQLGPVVRAYTFLGITVQDIRLLTLAILCGVLLTLAVKNALVVIQQRQISTFSGRISQEIRWRVLRFYFSAPLLWILHTGSANLLFVLSAGSNVGALLSQFLFMCSYALILCTIFLGLMAASPLPALLFLGTLFCSAICIVRFSRILLDRNSQRLYGLRIGAHTVEQVSVHGMRDIRFYTRENAFLDSYRSGLGALVAEERAQQTLFRLPVVLLELTGFLTLVLVLLFLIYGMDASMARISGVMGFLAAAAWRCLPIANRMVDGFSQVRGLLPFVSSVAETLEKDNAETLPRICAPARPEAELPFTRSIAFRDVSFTYPDSAKPALANISFTIPRGQMTGIVGLSGAGKSTLVNILTGVVHPTEGRVEVDGVVVDETNMRAWMRNIGYVAQSPYLLDATLAENIAFGKWGEPIDRERVLACCRMAALDFIDDLSEGIDTVLGERGVRLSGGQVQRVAIARALYCEPDVLIFDEATSALDQKNEQAIHETIVSLKKDLTIIIIAHRLTTVQECDKILWLEHGQLRASGLPATTLPLYEEYMQKCRT